MEFKIVYHYPESDEECEDEYYWVEVLLKGKQLVRYGDWYHEKGGARAEAFIEGYMAAFDPAATNKDYTVEKELINDDPDY